MVLALLMLVLSADRVTDARARYPIGESRRVRALAWA